MTKKIEEFVTPEYRESKHTPITKIAGPGILAALKEGKDTQIDNFAEHNHRKVSVGGDKVAWSFLQVNIEEEENKNTSMGGIHPPEFFYVKTKTGDIYKVFHKTSDHLLQAVRDIKKWEYVRENFPMQRCMFNPKTGNLVGIENPIIQCGKPFLCAPNCTTAPVVEIVGLSGSGSSTFMSDAAYTSHIEKEYNQQKKK